MRSPVVFSCCLIAACSSLIIEADDFDTFKKQAAESFNNFLNKSNDEFEDFRAKANEEMLDFMQRPWPVFKKEEPIKEKTDPEPIIVIPKDDEPQPEPKPEPKPIVIKEVVTPPKPKPQPMPVSPIKPKPVEVPKPDTDISLYGTRFSFKYCSMPKASMKTANEQNIIEAFGILTKSNMDNLLDDCLANRSNKNLCDWLYVKMIQKLSSRLYPEDTNMQMLLSGFLLIQSGYDIRFAYDTKGLFHVLFSCSGYYMNKKGFFLLDNKRYYPLSEGFPDNLNILPFKYPGEQAVSFDMYKSPSLAFAPGVKRELPVHSYPGITLSMTTNKNLIDFYNEYPTGTVDDSKFSKWAVYANIPASNEMKSNIYPVLKNAISGKNQRDAANILIKVAESFDYKRDIDMWGVEDRALFPDETWNYFYSDCEDHAINFTRLIRDLLDLDAVLLYYPGHLASAVAFTDNSAIGDYIVYKGRKYIVCDPTYFYANIGITMPDMDNKTAVVVELRK